MSYQLVNTAVFEDCVDAYRTNPAASAALGQTMVELMSKPFGNPKLQTHKVERAQGRTFTSYAGNKGHRVIWRLIDKAIVLLLFGEHDATYRRAENLRLQTDPETGLPEVHDVDPVDEQRRPYREQRQRVGRLFMAWRDDELAGLGLETHEVAALRELDTEADLDALEGHMRAEAHDIAIGVLLYGIDGTDDSYDEAGVDPEPAVDDEIVDDEERELADALTRPGATGEFVPVEPDFMLEILDRPIEDWMIFLHPDQAALVERTFNGPARIRGASGTGKTVVGLHRAARAARRGERVLFTTFIASLPPVLESLFERLAPDVAGQVEFAHLHGWARELLDVNGAGPKLDTKLIDKAWSNAWKRGEERDLKKLGSVYVREEVVSVIRARGLTELDDYLELRRVGRQRPLSDRQRRAVWSMAEHYRAALRRLGTIDHADALRLALDRVAGGEAPYDVVIVDESQDLDALGVRLAAALCGGPDGSLLLVGDGQQSVYPGAWTFAEVGLEVRGRSAILRTNYRNTREILEAAMGVVSGMSFDDGDDDPESGRRSVTVLRGGEPPVRSCFADSEQHDQALVERIRSLASRPQVELGDILIAAHDNHTAGEMRAVLGEAGIETMDLRSYKGQIDDRVKVGTHFRAKGLEFKQVLIPRVDRLTSRLDPDSPDRTEVAVRQLFVAMGRARDGLWIGAVSDESDPLEGLQATEAVLEIGAQKTDQLAPREPKARGSNLKTRGDAQETLAKVRRLADEGRIAEAIEICVSRGWDPAKTDRRLVRP